MTNQLISFCTPHVTFAFCCVGCRVLIAPQAAPYDQDPPLVTYRMQAGTVKYIWPLTQPVTDMGAQRKRAVALRQWLGWRINAGSCSSIECYSD